MHTDPTDCTLLVSLHFILSHSLQTRGPPSGDCGDILVANVCSTNTSVYGNQRQLLEYLPLTIYLTSQSRRGSKERIREVLCLCVWRRRQEQNGKCSGV